MKKDVYQEDITYYEEEILQIQPDFRAYFIKVYNYMALGLTLTGVVAFLVSLSPNVAKFILATPLAWLVLFIPIGLVYYLTARIHTLPAKAAQGLFWIYAAVMGLSFSSVFIAYAGISIAKTFFITAIAFAAASLYGYVTDRDLTRFDSFLFMGLLGLLLAGVINLFLKSSLTEAIISVMGVALFIGLTALDIQRIKLLYAQGDASGNMAKKAVLGALALYLDYINLFLHFLHFLGERKRND